MREGHFKNKQGNKIVTMIIYINYYMKMQESSQDAQRALMKKVPRSQKIIVIGCDSISYFFRTERCFIRHKTKKKIIFFSFLVI